jgi:DNA-binding transcriptional MerR regulator
MTGKLYKAADVCALAEVQPYVLRSWEKEFPGIGVEKSPDGPRLYRQADVDQVLRIKQLVFGDGLTLAGARRKLEESAPAPAPAEGDVAEVLEALAGDARTRIAHVRDGLRSILTMLSNAPGTAVVVDDFALQPPVVADGPVARSGASPRLVQPAADKAAKRRRASA